MYCYQYAKKENMYICIRTMHSMYHLNGEPGEYMNALLIIRTTVWRPLTNYTAYIVQWCLHRNGNLLQHATEYMGTPPVLSMNRYNKMSALLIIRTTVWRPLTIYTAYIVQWCLHRNGNLLQNATEYMGTPPVHSMNRYNKMSTLNLKGVMYRYAADSKVVEFLNNSHLIQMTLKWKRMLPLLRKRSGWLTVAWYAIRMAQCIGRRSSRLDIVRYWIIRMT